MGLRFELLERDGTPIKFLDGLVSGSAGWSETRVRTGGPGQGTFTIPNDHPDYAAIAGPTGWFRLVRCYLSEVESPDPASAEFLWVIQRDPRRRLSQSGRHDETTIVSGAGGLSVLGHGSFHSAVVVDSRGIRTFGWVADDYDDSSWGSAVAHGTQGDPDVDTLIGAPEGWPDPDAEWIWSRALDGNLSHPDGTSYFRAVWDPDGFTGNYRVYWTADNGGDLWVDADQKDAESVNRYFWREYNRFDMSTDGNPVQFAARVTNDVPTTGFNPAGLLLTVVSLDEQGDPDQVLFRSDESWKALDYEEPDGVSYGYVMSRLIDEAKDRGCLDGVSYDFDDDVDSDGQPWSVLLPIVSYRDGVQVGEVAAQGTQQFSVDCQMLPSLTFAAWDDLGDDLTGTVEFTDGTSSAVEARVDSRAPRATVARTETEGGFGWATDLTAVATYGRRETAATYGLAGSADEVGNAALELLDDLRGAVTQVLTTADLQGAKVGDLVSVRTKDGGPYEPYRVEAVSPTEADEAGNVEFDVDVERRL